jgi:hypothetical protein
MSAQLASVGIGPAEYLAQPGSEMLDVSRSALGAKHRNQNWVCEAAPILRLSETVKGVSAAKVLEDGWFAQTKPLVVGRLVDKSKGSKTKRFAFDKPQLRGRRPVWEEPPSPAHDEGLD